MFGGMEYVYEVYKEKSFSKAAQKLFIAQPSLSATIKKIETRLGMPIFDRSTTPIRLTECGAEYIKAAEKIMDIERDFAHYLNQLSTLEAGHIIIGASNLFASFILPGIISEFRNEYPLIEINLFEANTFSLEEQLLSGNLDLVIDNNEFNPTIYERHLFCREHLLLAVPGHFASNKAAASFRLSRKDILADKHTALSKGAVPLSFFQDDDFILLKSGNDTRTRADHIFLQAHIDPKIILTLDQQLTAYNMTCSGIGATFVSDTLIKHVKTDADIAFYKLSEPDSCLNLYFYVKKNKYITRAMYEFLKKAGVCLTE